MKPLLATTAAAPPDGGWGWVIVAAVALINMTNLSILSVFGLLFGGVLEQSQQSTFTAALITNLNSLALNFAGLLIGPAIKNFNPRNVTTTGCLLVSLGMTICGFADRNWHFIIGYSFFVGLGLGLISPSTFVAINSYFKEKRGRAVGLSLAGASLGQVFIPHLVRLLLDNYGFQTTAFSMALLSLTGLFGAALLKPFTIPPIHNNRQHMNILLETDDTKKLSSNIEIKIMNPIRVDENATGNVKASTQRKLCGKICHRLVEAMDLELLKDVCFLSIIVGMGLVYTSTINFTMLFPNFLKYSVGLSSVHTATCMSVVAGADISCRLLLPCITDRLKLPYRIIFLLGTIGLLISRSALAESTDMANIIVMSVLIGMSKSATVLNNNLTISSYCRPEKLPGGLGFNMIAKGVLVITVGQLLGWIRDHSKSYIICLHAQNVLLLVVVIVWTSEIGCRYWTRQQHRRRSSCEPIKAKLNNEELPICEKLPQMSSC